MCVTLCVVDISEEGAKFLYLIKTSGRKAFWESWDGFDWIWSHLGMVMDGVGSVLGRCWGGPGVVLERSWEILGRPWAVLERSLSVLRRFWAILRGPRAKFIPFQGVEAQVHSLPWVGWTSRDTRAGPKESILWSNTPRP